MSKLSVLVLVVGALVPAVARAQSGSDEREVAEAVSALPEPLRSGAEVRVYREGELVTIRPGDNGLICLGDDPDEERWHVACYHETLEPFMARGRALRAAGKGRAEVEEIRRGEIESGALPFPRQPVALYSLTAEVGAFDPTTGEAANARGLYVIYVPYATEAETGLPTEPSRERPWLMAAGEPWAHVMISRR